MHGGYGGRGWRELKVATEFFKERVKEGLALYDMEVACEGGTR